MAAMNIKRSEDSVNPWLQFAEAGNLVDSNLHSSMASSVSKASKSVDSSLQTSMASSISPSLMKAVDWNIEMIPPKNKEGTVELYPLMIKLCEEAKEAEKQNLVETILGYTGITGISRGLSSVGLGCHLNNYNNILQYTTDVGEALPAGSFFFLTNGEKVFDADFQS